MFEWYGKETQGMRVLLNEFTSLDVVLLMCIDNIIFLTNGG